jgi:hypothetical protein
MPNGLLRLFDKVTNNLLINLQILGTFNIEQNLNDTPSNMKIKAITNASFREEFEVNTIAYHEDTNTWWVIKSDESTYLHTGEYEHEISLVEFLEFFAYRHLANCAFAPNTYTLDQMLKRIFRIGNVLGVNYTYPAFLDKDKIMPFMSFENFTVANAIKNVARSLNAIPKMSGIFSVANGGSIIGTTLTFVNRSGIENTIVSILNDQFPIAYEKNANSNDQFLTRSVSNITNAKSSNLVVSPLSGGFKNFVPNNIIYDSNTRLNSKVFLPSKIDSIKYVNVLIPYFLTFTDNAGTENILFDSYVTDRQKIVNIINGISGLTSSEKQTAISNLPDIETFYRVEYNAPIDKDFVPAFDTSTQTSDKSNAFTNKMSLLSKFEFDTISKVVAGVTEVDTDRKNRTIHWLPNTNEIIMSLSLRNSLTGILDHNQTLKLFEDTGSPRRLVFNSFSGTLPNEKILVQVGYYPISDIKVSIDNDNNAQDEKFFNQTGKVIDAFSTTQLITSHTNDSVEGTKIRNARYTNFNNLLPVGQLVRDSNQIYVISQRSIDGQVKDGNEYYNVLYTLSRNRVARSENITADSSVISYKTPDDNLVFRNQLYKDYIELSLNNINQDTPYLSMNKALVFGTNLAGTNFDYTVLASNQHNTPETIITRRYVKNPIVYDLHKSKLMNVNWQDNNVLGFRFDRATGVLTNTLVQTPIVYTDDTGKATNFELLFLNQQDLKNARDAYNTPTFVSDIIPFQDLTTVNQLFYNNQVLLPVNYSIRLRDNNPLDLALFGSVKPYSTREDLQLYNKDPFEIPVFEYMLQANDEYSNKGNVVVSNDLFSTFTGDLIYRYIISNDKRITSENALALYGSVGGLSWVLTTNPFFYQEPEPNTAVYDWQSVSDPLFYQLNDPTATIYKWQFVSQDYYYQPNDPAAQVKTWGVSSTVFYYSNSTPVFPSNNSLWYIPDTGELYRRVPGNWEEYDGVWSASSTAPSIGSSNELWVNTSDELLYISSVTTPTIPTGTLWYRTDTGVLFQRSSSNTWNTISSSLVTTGTSLTTPTSAGLYFVDLSEPVLYISVFDSTPEIAEGSYWFNESTSVLKRWLAPFDGVTFGWVTIPSGDVTTGTSLPSVSSADKYFVNTTLKVLYISFLVSGSLPIFENSYWYNPADNTLKQYRPVIGTLQWVSATAIISNTQPEITTTNQRWVNTLTEQLFISQFVPAADLEDNELNRAVISRTGNKLNFVLYSDISGGGTLNTSPIKNIAFYAYDTTGTKVKFLFAINDYAGLAFWEDGSINFNTYWQEEQPAVISGGLWYKPSTQQLYFCVVVPDGMGGFFLVWVETTKLISETEPSTNIVESYWVKPSTSTIYVKNFNSINNIEVYINNWKI